MTKHRQYRMADIASQILNEIFIVELLEITNE